MSAIECPCVCVCLLSNVHVCVSVRAPFPFENLQPRKSRSQTNGLFSFFFFSLAANEVTSLGKRPFDATKVKTEGATKIPAPLPVYGQERRVKAKKLSWADGLTDGPGTPLSLSLSLSLSLDLCIYISRYSRHSRYSTQSRCSTHSPYINLLNLQHIFVYMYVYMYYIQNV